MKQAYLFPLFLLWGCGSPKIDFKTIEKELAIEEYSCPAEKLCAMGEGDSYDVAETKAREALGKVFESKIVGNTSAYSSLTGESFRREIKETVDETLQGVEIVHRDKKGDKFWAFAGVNKKILAQQILRQIERIDGTLAIHYRKGEGDDFARVFKKRERLEDRYSFLTEGKRVPPSKEYGDMAKKMEKVASSRKQKTILLTSDESAIGEMLSAKGYKVIFKKEGTYSLELIPTLKVKELHFNVKGFKKYNFSLNVVATNSKGEHLDSFIFSSTKSGRNRVQAEESAMMDIIVHLGKKIDKLIVGENL